MTKVVFSNNIVEITKNKTNTKHECYIIATKNYSNQHIKDNLNCWCHDFTIIKAMWGLFK